MKTSATHGSARHAAILLLACAGLVLFVIAISSRPARVQNTSPPQSGSQHLLSTAELDQIVAPIALYPDPLLSEVLMASTYPLEIAEARQWSKRNKALKGAARKGAVAREGWDASIKSLTAVPEVLALMRDKFDWTQKLGDAVLAQQAHVMEAIQRLRHTAQANGKLNSTGEQTVSVRKQADKAYLVIAPAQPQTMYVPHYDPAVVYGAWAYPAYPPYVFPPPDRLTDAAIEGGIAFATGVAVGAWAVGKTWWGGGFNWGGNNIYVNNDVDITISRNTWVHNPAHRQGVRYANDTVRQKYAHRDASGVNRRMAFRGHDGEMPQHRDDNATRERRDLERDDDRRADLQQAGIEDRPKQAAQRRAHRTKSTKRPTAVRPKARPAGSAFAGVNRGTLAPVHADRGAASFEDHMRAARASLGARGHIGDGRMGKRWIAPPAAACGQGTSGACRRD